MPPGGLPANPRRGGKGEPEGGASTTPGNGSLGSGVDEERGDMRYVVRIAGTQRAIESSNAHCARRQPGGPARPSAAPNRPSPRAGGVGALAGPRRSAAGRPNASGVRRTRGRAQAARGEALPPAQPKTSPRPRHARRAGEGRRGAARTRATKRRPRIGQGYPLNLSISVSGGKETNRDCPSSGERSGNSPDLKSGPPPARGGARVAAWRGRAAGPPRAGPLEARRPSPLERGAAEGESPVRPRAAGPGRRGWGRVPRRVG